MPGNKAVIGEIGWSVGDNGDRNECFTSRKKMLAVLDDQQRDWSGN